ncbi:meiotically up-regulated protein [Diaporthe amygdali]|uniref:meiotically up-regulated protein n=1 Tax=Phomopsis amygdali TaxID=1214568 RepID=UPI0022FEC249|nr:meiotically up-regulated protein [Diaporthe amygdali]KAJ0119069.1 meiotically up-regulated protein [Diaporthe amygdali]
MGSRFVRIGLLALTTALLLYYHASILSFSTRDVGQETEKIIQIPISQTQPGNTKWPFPPADAGGSELTQIPPGLPGSGSGANPPTDGAPQAASGSSSAFNEVKFEFQEDLTRFVQPVFDIAKLKQYRAHNDRGPGQFAFATYLSTRDNSVADPYFLSAMQLVYRILWDPKSRSASHPVVVFVAPFIPQQQRDLLQAAGAIVRELELVPWDPPKDESGGQLFPFARWRDLFSKLNIWAQLDFARVAFLDLDAFPVRDLDLIFDESVSPRQRCRAELLPPEDRIHEAEICDYVFAGHGLADGVNVGVIVLEPNRYMHQRLLRECQDTTKFDNKMAEQAFLNYAFGRGGPFPPYELGREWNGFYPTEEEQGLLRIVHEKLWIFGDNTAWTKDIFSNGWFELLTLYQSPEFEAMRALDGPMSQSFGFGGS